MKLIYVVEDHDVIRSGVVQYLELSNYSAKGFESIEKAKNAIKEQLPDLIIQDVMLPDGNGFSFVKEVKNKYPELPIIFMTARAEEADKIIGFELGCDDYISKPFSPKELVLRVNALFRRLDSSLSPSSILIIKNDDNILTMDSLKHEVKINDIEISLTAAEWKILSYLAQNRGALISRSQILSECFEYSFESYERVVDTHIKNLRAKLNPLALIETVRGYGYRMS